MRTNLPQQFINRLSMTNDSFYAIFKHKRFGVELKERILFAHFLMEGKPYWRTETNDLQRFVVSKYNRYSVHLFAYVAGCKVSLVLPLSQLHQIKPVNGN